LTKDLFAFEHRIDKNIYKPLKVKNNSDQLPAINFNIIKKCNMNFKELNLIKDELEKFVPSAATP